MATVRPLPPENADARLAAFTVPNVAEAISREIDADLQQGGTTDVTAPLRCGTPRFVKEGRCEYLLPTVIHCESSDVAIARKEYMFPFVTVVTCPEATMVDAVGATLVCTAITENEAFQQSLLDAVHIDQLNFGPTPTTRLNWLQPHEGNIIEFLFRARAFQRDAVPLAV